MRTSVLYTVMAVALVVGTACKGPDGLDVNLNSFEVVLRGANVVPAAADTTTAGYLTITGGATITWAGKVISKGPATGTIDSIGIYQQAAGTALAATANATALLCATAAACAAASGTATLVGTATAATVTTSMRGYGSQLVVFTTVSGATAALRMASGGVMRGTIYNLGS